MRAGDLAGALDYLLCQVCADSSAGRTDESRGAAGDDARATRHVEHPFTRLEISHCEQAGVRRGKLLLPELLIIADGLIPAIALDAALQACLHGAPSSALAIRTIRRSSCGRLKTSI